MGSIGLEQGLAVSCSLEHTLGLPWSQGNSGSEALGERGKYLGPLSPKAKVWKGWLEGGG